MPDKEIFPSDCPEKVVRVVSLSTTTSKDVKVIVSDIETICFTVILLYPFPKEDFVTTQPPVLCLIISKEEPDANFADADADTNIPVELPLDVVSIALPVLVRSIVLTSILFIYKFRLP